LAAAGGGSPISAEKAPASLPFPAEKLPPEWRVVKHFAVPAGQTAAIGKKLGGEIQALTNTLLSYRGGGIKANVIACRTAGDAQKIHRALMKMKGHRWLCLLRGKTVVEFVCRDLRLARRAHYALGYEPLRATYRLKFEMAAVAKADYGAANRLFNALLRLRQRPGDDGLRKQVAALSSRFEFGSTLALRSCGSGGKAPEFSFAVKPAAARRAAAGDVTAYEFGKLPRRNGIPYVEVRARVDCPAFAARPSSRKDRTALLAPSGHWPVKDPQVARLGGKITAKARTGAEKVEAILEWLLPGRNVKYGGPMGSRKGVAQTLKARQGRCWDFADCFVTLCRAAGVPSRQVAGWLHGQCGHVWAEVLLEGKGWVQVDPTAGMACGSDYIPYLTTEDGEMPILYLSMPEIETAKGEDKPDPESR
jgi:hypothetical protein